VVRASAVPVGPGCDAPAANRRAGKFFDHQIGIGRLQLHQSMRFTQLHLSNAVDGYPGHIDDGANQIAGRRPVPCSDVDENSHRTS
jgi:hypothetical protein